MGERCADLLRDESKLEAAGAERVYFPESPADVAAAVCEAREAGEPVTVSGARTGIVGGAVPVDARWVVSLSRMKRVGAYHVYPPGEAGVRVGAGVTLAELAAELAGFDWSVFRGEVVSSKWYYPVDPTEPTAEVGGTIATNASGGRSFRYGPTRAWVRELTVVLADGREVDVIRGDPWMKVKNGILCVRDLRGDRELALPKLARPACKCAAGYFVEPDMDLIDLFIGSEGTLGVIVEAELMLMPEPANVLSLMCFLCGDGADERALAMVGALRKDRRLSPLSIEYLGATALDLVREEKELSGDDKIPELPANARAAVFMEEPYEDDSELDQRVEAIDEVLSAHGGSLDETWAGDDDASRERIRVLRHSVPEAVNNRIARRKREVPSLHKVGTDLAVPDRAFAEMLGAYREKLPASGLEYVVFGHAGENHLHVNFIPRCEEELERAKALHEDLARLAVSLGGAVTAEHGIGRLKRKLLEIQYGAEGVRELRRVKDFFDPEGLLNPGVMFAAR
ncbi:MAG: FAD-binding oxidoreductase [Planctomycetota bacterium]